MRTKWLNASVLSAAAGLLVVSGCVVQPDGRAVLVVPSVQVSAPVVVAPAVEVQADVMVPDEYAWDGVEYVGVVNGAYFYLGPGNVWLACDGVRLGRFHGWERGHADWRVHAIRNERFRRDAHGREQPRRDDHRPQPNRGKTPEKPKKPEEK